MSKHNMPDRVKLDPDYNGHDGQVVGWASDKVDEGWPEYVRADAITPQAAAKLLLSSFDSIWDKRVAISSENERESVARNKHKWTVVAREGVRAALSAIAEQEISDDRRGAQ
jgi:hypothetical protein